MGPPGLWTARGHTDELGNWARTGHAFTSQILGVKLAQPRLEPSQFKGLPLVRNGFVRDLQEPAATRATRTRSPAHRPPHSSHPLMEPAPRASGPARAPRAAPPSPPLICSGFCLRRVGIAAPAGRRTEERLTFSLLTIFPTFSRWFVEGWVCVWAGGGGTTHIVLSPVSLFFVSPHEQISLPNLAFQKDQQKKERTISGPCPSWGTGTVSNAFI